MALCQAPGGLRRRCLTCPAVTAPWSPWTGVQKRAQRRRAEPIQTANPLPGYLPAKACAGHVCVVQQTQPCVCRFRAVVVVSGLAYFQCTCGYNSI